MVEGTRQTRDIVVDATGVDNTRILNKEIGINLMHMDTCFLSGRRYTVYSENRDTVQIRVVEWARPSQNMVYVIDSNLQYRRW